MTPEQNLVLLRLLHPRGNGKTHVMLHGSANQNCTVIVHNYDYGQSLKKQGVKNVVSLNDLMKLQGRTDPIVFDHYALLHFIKGVAREATRQAYEDAARIIEVLEDKYDIVSPATCADMIRAKAKELDNEET